MAGAPPSRWHRARPRPPAAAKLHFQRAAELRPHDEAAYNNLAIALSMLGDHAGAVRALREAVRLRPDQAATYKNLSTALALAGRLDEARAARDQYERLQHLQYSQNRSR